MTFLGNKIEKIDINSEEYPSQLREISNPPKQLYCCGNRELLYEESVAVVGSRKFTIYGKNMHISDNMKDTLKKKFEKFDRYFEKETEVFATFTLSYVQTDNGEKKYEGIRFSDITCENNSYSFEVETLPLEEGKTNRKIKILSTTYELAENTTAEITSSFIGDSPISVKTNGTTVGSDDFTSVEDNGRYNNIYTIKNNNTKQGVIAIGELDVVENGGNPKNGGQNGNQKGKGSQSNPDIKNGSKGDQK